MVSCKEYVEKRKKEIKDKLEISSSRPPCLCVIQVGDDPASCSYIKGKKKDCDEVGIECHHIHYTNISEYNLLYLIEKLNNDINVDGIIVQLPLPSNIDTKKVQEAINREKDVDGFRKDSLFKPCTPKGVIDYLEFNEIKLEGSVCTVVGRSEIVGKPLANMLIDRGATVISCNSKTDDKALKIIMKSSDIVITAIGKPEYFTDKYLDKDQIIIDVGINRNSDGKLCGDISEEVKINANPRLYTPVPGGVGLLTRLALLENTLNAWEMIYNEL